MMGKVVVRFNTKSQSMSIPDAINLAEDCEHYIEDKYYHVHFDEPYDNLKKLLDLIGSLKTTQIFLDDKEINSYTLKEVLFCRDKLLCDGICKHIQLGYYPLDNFTAPLTGESGEGTINEYEIRRLTPFLEKRGENEFFFGKEKLKEYIKDEYFFELEYCDKINLQKIIDLVDGIPNILKLRDRSSYRDEISDEEFDTEVDEESSREEIKEIAEIFADAFEKRLRKVFKEYLGGTKK